MICFHIPANSVARHTVDKIFLRQLCYNHLYINFSVFRHCQKGEDKVVFLRAKNLKRFPPSIKMKWWRREAAAPKLCDEQAEPFFSTSKLSLLGVFVAVIVVVIRALSNHTNHKRSKEKKAMKLTEKTSSLDWKKFRVEDD